MKIIFLLCCLGILLTNLSFGKTPEDKIITPNEEILELKAIIKSNDERYQQSLSEANKQISELSKTLGDTKQAFYDSRLNLWNFILAGFGLIVIILGYFGYNSISKKINDFKTESDSSIRRSEEAVKDVKNDLIQRISEIKSDVREFKAEQHRSFEKFERDANTSIDNGLNNSLQKAIDNIMTGSFSSDLNNLTEQVSELQKKVDDLISNNDNSKKNDELVSNGNDNEDGKNNANAFDDEE